MTADEVIEQMRVEDAKPGALTFWQYLELVNLREEHYQRQLDEALWRNSNLPGDNPSINGTLWTMSD